ncbi:ABC transporter ATP-binding protein [Agrobacterium rosae]|uniref:ABC transporter n=1 Tax=Agrobacterium rosae TaxID=1972867 RepID=A0AAE5VRK4_9HYPH|nr:ABC transporter ATP-binding protein [Agrobacterium rosae]KAA3511120.1 ABC transporter ATP-binding protein [Agrobacterium rosae]KAA3518158.1 ABC transporter ATP-binding protein [Agrobacterium rosae]MCM2434466.1 ABC transporter ATP-binding protein [Agrobacterium rosae]MDX8329266.1 ABC transporter ATP-binding protein [Agrobacterium rosae]MQB49748.1 ABC transporter ATP-binding protein [Agrobacterium rosae]
MLSLTISGLTVSYPGLAAPVLSIGELKVAAGEMMAISGASGSGKSTFVNVITGLERIQEGTVTWGDQNIAGLTETRRDRWRGENVGLVMQEFHLLPGLSAIENVLLPVRLSRAMCRDYGKRAADLLEKTGLGRPDQNINTMSRGEMQRVAIARALLRKPGVIVADEPTASLDPGNGETIGRLLVDLARADGTTLIVITHDRLLAQRLDRRLELANGRILTDIAGNT